MTCSDAPFGIPYSSPCWPARADREAYRERMRREYPRATEAQIEQLGAALAMLDKNTKSFVAVDQEEAEDLAFTRAVPHSPYGFAIIDRNAA